MNPSVSYIWHLRPINQIVDQLLLFSIFHYCLELCFDLSYDAYPSWDKVLLPDLPSSVRLKLKQYFNHMRLDSDEAALTVSDATLATRQQHTTASENEILGCDAQSGQTLTDLLSFPRLAHQLFSWALINWAEAAGWVVSDIRLRY